MAVTTKNNLRIGDRVYILEGIEARYMVEKPNTTPQTDTHRKKKKTKNDVGCSDKKALSITFMSFFLINNIIHP